MLVGGMAMGKKSAQRQMQMQQEAYQQGQQAQQQQPQQAPQAAAQPAAQASAAPQKDTTAELMKLADLHKAGALTDQEFEAAKKKLLT
jgi:hypothetical protein